MRKRTASKLGGVGLLAASLALSSCSDKDPEPAPLLEDCVGENCKTIGSPGGNNKPGDGSGGSGGGSDLEGVTTTVVGTILSTVDAGFLLGSTYVGASKVKAQGANGSIIETDTAAGQFIIEDVAAGVNWFSLEDQHVQRTLIPTLQPVVVDPDNPQTVLVGVDEQIFLSVLDLMVPTQIPQANAGHAILFFTRSNNQPVSGVSIKSWASAGAVAYDASPSYEVADPPDQGATGALGAVMLVNLPAIPYPGSSVDIQFEEEGGDTKVVTIRVASGHVTRAAVVVD